MSTTTFEHFNEELNRLVSRFEAGFRGFTAPDYSEARLRQDFLDPLFRALGWDLENKQGLLQNHREVEIESRTDIAGRAKRADYLFRTERIDRFICEAKKPSEELRGHAFQAKRYAWNKGVVLAVLSDFEDLHVYVVGSRPHADEPEVGKWKTWSFRQYPLVAQELWDLLSREAVASGGIDKAVDAIPRTSKAKGRGKARQQWLIKPDRSRALDTEFLNFLDEARRTLAQDLLKENDRDDLLEDNRLNEAVQRILDRLLFLRICEDRDIDTGRPLAHILRNWRERSSKPVPRRLRDAGLWANDEGGGFAATDPRPAAWPLWKDVIAHFKALDRRPPSHIPFFNGNLFKEHFSETLKVGDEWLANFLDDVSDDESPYLFNVIPVEILGTIYERFLGKIVRPHGKGALIEEKPEVRKAGGVYYTPRYIVDYIVEQTVGKLLEDKTPEKSLELKILDPACGSGSFLIRAFERMCEHWQADLTKHPSKRKRQICWVDETTGDVHLSTDLKRRILTSNIYGVDLDSGAVEVTQLSLYLKMLEGENRQTLAAERDLFGNDVALLPALQDNIKNGNSLIASDFSLVAEDLLRVHAFDWSIQFRDILEGGGFDAVIGNPPYVRPHNLDGEAKKYYWKHYKTFTKKSDLYCCFIERAIQLCGSNSRFSFIVSNGWLRLDSFEMLRRLLLDHSAVEQIVDLPDRVFADAQVKTCIVVCRITDDRGIQDSQRLCVRQQLEPGEEHKFFDLRQIPLKMFRQTYKSVFDISISPETESVKSKVKKAGLPVGDLFDVCFGLKTGDDDKFLHFGKNNPEDRPLLRGEDVGRYCQSFKNEFVWYVPQQMRLHRKTARPGDARRFEQPKVLIKDTTSVFAGTYDDQGFYVKDVLIVVPFDAQKPPGVSLKAVTGILNSRLLTFYYRTTFQTIHVQRNELASLPLYSFDLSKEQDRSRHEKLVGLVDKMLVLAPKLRAELNDAKRTVLQNAVDATDHQIDMLVYELYGLTKDEIALVEKGNS